MVQEKIASLSNKGTTFQTAQKEKDKIATPGASKQHTSKVVGGKYGAWGPVFKDKQNFADMHHF